MLDNNNNVSQKLAALHTFMTSQHITDENGKMVYNNPDATTEEKDANVHYTVGTEMEGPQFAILAEGLKIKNLRAVSSQQSQFTPGQQFTHLFEQMYRENAEKRSLQNIAFFSRPRSHIYGIQLKMNRKGYIVAKIADSLKTSYSESSHERIEHDELLKAIKAHNKAVWNKRKNIEGVVARRKAYQEAEDKSEFKYNGKAYRQRKSDDAVQIVSCYAQNIQNSCGLHTGLNLCVMNKDPNITNTSQFGQTLEEKINTLKGQSNQKICISKLANVMQIAITELQNAKQPEKQVQQRYSLNNEVRTGPARQM